MYYFKLIILFLTIGMLTWYSKNGSALFISSSKKIFLCSYQNDILIVYKNSIRKSNHHVVISPGLWAACHPELLQISEWDCISSGSPLDMKCIPPPAHWFVTDLQKAITAPNWPQPLQLPSVYYSHNVQISLKPNTSNETIVQCMIDSISFLILSDSATMNDRVLRPFFESIDILIVRTNSPELASACRSYIRPRLCVTTAISPVTSTTPANMIFLGSSCTSLELTISAQKKVSPVIKSCVLP